MRMLTKKEVIRKSCEAGAAVWDKHLKNRKSIRLDTALRLAFKLGKCDYVDFLTFIIMRLTKSQAREVVKDLLLRKLTVGQLRSYINLLDAFRGSWWQDGFIDLLLNTRAGEVLIRYIPLDPPRVGQNDVPAVTF